MNLEQALEELTRWQREAGLAQKERDAAVAGLLKIQERFVGDEFDTDDLLKISDVVEVALANFAKVRKPLV